MSAEVGQLLNLTNTFSGLLGLLIFLSAGFLSLFGRNLSLPKSQPVLVASIIIWLMIAITYHDSGFDEAVIDSMRYDFLTVSEIMIFLIVLIVFMNILRERLFFEWIKEKLIQTGFGYLGLFWFIGILCFCFSPLINNITLVLLMSSIVMAIGGDNQKFVSITCTNIVVATNAGSSFSPFGDIVTLLVWHHELVHALSFFHLFLPALLSFLLPTLLMGLAVPNGSPKHLAVNVKLKRGTGRIIIIFLGTLVITAAFNVFFGLPPFFGMLLGLSFLNFFGFFLLSKLPKSVAKKRAMEESRSDMEAIKRFGEIVPFNIFNQVARAEWDAILFFCGVALSIGGLSFMGYMSVMNELIYVDYKPEFANVIMGITSALIQNVTLMTFVLSMSPAMSLGDWLLANLTISIGGSLLSVGSAAGLTLMIFTKGQFTFLSHLRWSMLIFLGYIAAILCHFLLNKALFSIPSNIPISG